ncbi:hypothetical protein AVEN_125032-1 [Araneus ventricosus]|uniref:Uncharacterized protein n=1 Tax=Araneus ventricosus TaxID=182803 RepID=A0A4Y2H1E6_ARAVE|nr:hypothetical protein AVEN_125032-1 [Araneus ventricosus]
MGGGNCCMKTSHHFLDERFATTWFEAGYEAYSSKQMVRGEPNPAGLTANTKKFSVDSGTCSSVVRRSLRTSKELARSTVQTKAYFKTQQAVIDGSR